MYSLTVHSNFEVFTIEINSCLNIYNLPLKVALKLLDSTIKPILLYCSGVWEPFLNQGQEKWDKGNVIEKAYLQFLKQLLGVNRSTTNAMVRGELDRHCLQEEILRRNINYTKYLSQKNDNWYVKQAYTYELSRDLTHITIVFVAQSPSFLFLATYLVR